MCYGIDKRLNSKIKEFSLFLSYDLVKNKKDKITKNCIYII